MGGGRPSGAKHLTSNFWLTATTLGRALGETGSNEVSVRSPKSGIKEKLVKKQVKKQVRKQVQLI